MATKSMEKLDARMSAVKDDTMRLAVLKCAKDFKTSWIELGQALYTVWKDKKYKEWGYLTFEAYTAQEIGIRNQTAVKLLRSYQFLEAEEPAYISSGASAVDNEAVSTTPSLDTVNALRLAKKNRSIDEHDYEKMKRDVFENGRDDADIKKRVAVFIKQRQEDEPGVSRSKRRLMMLRRFLATIKSLKREMELGSFVNQAILKDIAKLVSSIEGELSLDEADE